MKTIAAAFVRAQKEFAPALKTSTNPHFKSKYVDLAGCIEAVIDALNSNGIALMQSPQECEDGVTVETIFVHESGETLSGGKFHVPSQKQDAQGYGSALTYCRRYGLMAACGIAPEDDDGNAATKAGPSVKAAGVNMDDAMLAIRECEDADTLKTVFGNAWKVATVEQRKALEKAKDKRKEELQGVEA